MATHDEEESFRLFWSWLTGKELTDPELTRMRSQHDPPDFQFVHDGKCVALEHTQVFRPTSTESLRPLHDEAIQKEICGQLLDFLRQPNSLLPPVCVCISFGSCHMVKKTKLLIARGVFDLISKRLGNGTSLPMKLYMSDLSEISPCLAEVSITGIGASSNVVRHAAGCVEEWGLGIFEIAANKKAEDLPRYKARFDQCWLLLSTGGPHPAQWMEPCLAACTIGIRTDFDRVFVVDHDQCERQVLPIAVNH